MKSHNQNADEKKLQTSSPKSNREKTLKNGEKKSLKKEGEGIKKKRFQQKKIKDLPIWMRHGYFFQEEYECLRVVEPN